MKYKGWSFSFHLLLLTSYFLLLTSLIACGKRGDPIAIEPRPEKAVEEKPVNSPKAADVLKEQGLEKPESVKGVSNPAPTGLVGIYTQQSIVLTWNEVEGIDISSYRIYRSTGDGRFVMAGETVTPAFTDKDIKPNLKYFYKVTAVGAAEGPPSKEIEITTEIK
ncbi:MAG: fibronectin type III domain-containing protein [Nitrospirae bacterium]|nr:fibronectin type III domain-containing protein [Nitrospirota bacterium]